MTTNRAAFALTVHLILCTVCAACAGDEGVSQPLNNLSPQETSQSKVSPREHTVEKFRRIDRRTTMKEVIALCGEPDRDVGSGIHIYVYDLADGSYVRIGTPDDKQILYVVHVTADGEEHRLFEGK